MRLSDLKSGQSAVIVKILGHGAFRKRVMEMGFVKGRKITSILSAPQTRSCLWHAASPVRWLLRMWSLR